MPGHEDAVAGQARAVTTLGTRFPAPMRDCLARLAALSASDVRARYALTSELAIEVLRNRSRGETTACGDDSSAARLSVARA